MEVYLIRHTTPAIEKGLCYGQADIPLAKTFHTEKEILLDLLPGHVDAVYSSPSKRCHQLACCIAAIPSIITDTRLMEMHFGDWELKKWEELEKDLLNTWMNDFVTVKVPNGENFVDMDTRVQNFIRELTQTNHQRVAIITHAGVIRCFVAYVLGIDLKNAFKIQIAYSSITKINLQADTCLNSVEYMNRTGSIH